LDQFRRQALRNARRALRKTAACASPGSGFFWEANMLFHDVGRIKAAAIRQQQDERQRRRDGQGASQNGSLPQPSSTPCPRRPSGALSISMRLRFVGRRPGVGAGHFDPALERRQHRRFANGREREQFGRAVCLKVWFGVGQRLEPLACLREGRRCRSRGRRRATRQDPAVQRWTETFAAILS